MMNNLYILIINIFSILHVGYLKIIIKKDYYHHIRVYGSSCSKTGGVMVVVFVGLSGSFWKISHDLPDSRRRCSCNNLDATLRFAKNARIIACTFIIFFT